MPTENEHILLSKKAELVKAIAHPLRIAIVELLRQGECCVCDIAVHLGAERSNVSRHLSVMVAAGLLTHRKQGLKMLYSLKTPCVNDFLDCVTACLKQQVRENQKLLDSL